MTVIKSPHGIFGPSNMIVAKDGKVTAEFAEQIRNLVHEELAKLEEPMEAHIAEEIKKQLVAMEQEHLAEIEARKADYRKRHVDEPRQLHGLKPNMEVK